jgi:lipoyl(octanoyl) transferase
MTSRVLDVVSLGVMAYGDALVLQRAAAQARIDGALARDALLLVEHPPVITFGRSTDRAHVLVGEASRVARGVALFEVERGGDVTFHGPGQLVGYPIIDLRRHREDLHWYLRRLEDVQIAALGALSIAAERREKLTGVWTRGRKIASIGVHARSWVTWHGFALNVTTDLSYFDLIVPCGIDDVTMTSVARERDALRLPAMSEHDLASVAEAAIVDAMGDVFSLRPEHVALHGFVETIGTIGAR